MTLGAMRRAGKTDVIGGKVGREGLIVGFNMWCVSDSSGRWTGSVMGHL